MSKLTLVNPEIDDIVDVDAAGNVVEAPEEVEIALYIYTNKGADAPAESLLRMFYEGAGQNTIGIMRALNNDTGLEELLLVGVDVNDNGSTVYPIAKILGHGDAAKYDSPDGKGGWFSPELKRA